MDGPKTVTANYVPQHLVKVSTSGLGSNNTQVFNGATFGDLNRGKGPMIMASATDISTGSRLVFQQSIFNVLCSDLNAVRLSRAAAASSAVPVVLSAVTINNYGGTCNFAMPPFCLATSM